MVNTDNPSVKPRQLHAMVQKRCPASPDRLRPAALTVTGITASNPHQVTGLLRRTWRRRYLNLFTLALGVQVLLRLRCGSDTPVCILRRAQFLPGQHGAPQMR